MSGFENFDQSIDKEREVITSMRLSELFNHYSNRNIGILPLMDLDEG